MKFALVGIPLPLSFWGIHRVCPHNQTSPQGFRQNKVQWAGPPAAICHTCYSVSSLPFIPSLGGAWHWGLEWHWVTCCLDSLSPLGGAWWTPACFPRPSSCCLLTPIFCTSCSLGLNSEGSPGTVTSLGSLKTSTSWWYTHTTSPTLTWPLAMQMCTATCSPSTMMTTSARLSQVQTHYSGSSSRNEVPGHWAAQHSLHKQVFPFGLTLGTNIAYGGGEIHLCLLS